MSMLKKKIWIFFIFAYCVLPINIFAYEAVDIDKNGSIDVTLKYQEKKITDGTLSIYCVANVQQNNNDLSFVLAPDFKDSHQSLEHLESLDTAKHLWQYIQNHQLKAAQTIINTNGKIIFEGLKPGLYLIVQTSPSTGYYALNPFLVSLPIKDQTTGTYQYHVSASGKFEMKPTTDTSYNPNDPNNPDDPNDPNNPNNPDDPNNPNNPNNPDNPKGSKLPSTGQLKWPIPVLAVSGMTIFVFGWAMYSKKN